MTKSEKLELDNFLIPASQLDDSVGRIFPTITSMDIALSGGIPEGVNVLISGAPKIGKTSFSLYYAAQCQKVDSEKQVFFFDCEGRLRPELLRTTKDLDLARFNIVKSTTKHILSAENYLNLIVNTLKDYPCCLCILDSIASLAPEAELSSLIGDSQKRASTATLMYKVFRQTSQILSVTKSTFIGLTHLIANPNVMGKTNYAAGGRAMQYGCSVHLEGAYKEDIKSGDKVIGQNACFKVVASALGPPGAKVMIPIIYGKGVDRPTDVFNLSLELGLIQKSGAWFHLPNPGAIPDLPYKDGDIPKIQGQEKTTEFLRKNPDVLGCIDDYIRSMMLTK